MTTATPRRAITAGPSPAPPAPPPPAPPGEPVAAADGPARGSAPAPTPGRPPAPSVRLGGRPPAVPVSVALEIVAAMIRGTRVEPISVAADITHDLHVHLRTAADFLAWCRWLKIPHTRLTRRTPLHLGPMAEATTVREGWTVHLRLSGPPVEELP